MPGQHNVLNALGVLAVADFLGIPFETYVKAIAQFEGVARRFTVRGEVGGVTDRRRFRPPPRRGQGDAVGRAQLVRRAAAIVAAFQPHRFTRTRDQLGEFARAFHDADKVVVCDIFAAGEKPIDGVIERGRGQARPRRRPQGHHVRRRRREDVAPWLDAQAKPGDLVITLGAGNIQLSCNEVIELLEKRLGAATKKNLVRIDESSATVAR